MTNKVIVEAVVKVIFIVISSHLIDSRQRPLNGYFDLTRETEVHGGKLMRIKLSNRKWHYLQILDCARLPTITIIVRYMKSEIDDAGCIVADL